MPSKNMPPDWQPPVDAWQSAFDAGLTHVVFGYFGCQYHNGEVPKVFANRFRKAIEGENGPSYTTRACYRDSSGYTNDVFIAYWPSRESYASWWGRAGFGIWFDHVARITEEFGIWREVYAVPTDRFETLFSTRNPTGAAMLGQPFGETVREHNYWGGMRDRILASTSDTFKNEITASRDGAYSGNSRGKRITISLGGNICLIRSGQDWRHCDEAEFNNYSDEVVPHLTAGMAFLRDNPVETGCLSCRLMDEVSLDGKPANQTFGLAAFVSMTHLEDWAKNHPTHLRIFNSFLEMVQRRREPPKLRLWHEVLVTDQDGSTCEYVNCHPLTGFLPYNLWAP